MRLIESQWFTWITSMSHLPMEIVPDKHGKNGHMRTLAQHRDMFVDSYHTYHPDDWVRRQLRTTQNVEGSYFNNWFTGHLNYQIEHHLFPMMVLKGIG